MASSEVEIVSTSNPFGCVLKDHNRRDHHWCRDSNHPTTTATTTASNTGSSKSNSNFQKNLKELVRDHLQSCINIAPKPRINVNGPDENFSSNSNFNSSSNPNPNPNPHNRFQTSCCGKPIRNRRSNHHRHQSKTNGGNSRWWDVNGDEEGEGQRPQVIPPPTMSRRRARVLDRWATQQAKEIITTMERQDHQAEISALSSCHSVSSTASSFSVAREPSPAPSDSSSSSAPVSSLVQKWGGKIPPPSPPRNDQTGPIFQNPNAPKPPNPSSSGGLTVHSRANSLASSAADSCNHENESVGNRRESNRAAVACGESRSVGGDGAVVSDKEEKWKEKERIRVADIIKKWPAGMEEKKRLCGGVEGGGEKGEGVQQSTVTPVVNPLARLRISLEHGGDAKGGLGFCTPSLLCSPRIRGRQAVADLLARLETDRYGEIEWLSERHAVTKFPQRGRIQSLLKLRFLRREVSTSENHQWLREPLPPRTVCTQKSSQLEQEEKQKSSSVSSIRERFNNNTRAEERDSAGSSARCTGHVVGTSSYDLDHKHDRNVDKASNINNTSSSHPSAQAVTSDNRQEEPGLTIRTDQLGSRQVTTASKAAKDDEYGTNPQEVLLDRTATTSNTSNSQQEDNENGTTSPEVFLNRTTTTSKSGSSQREDDENSTNRQEVLLDKTMTVSKSSSSQREDKEQGNSETLSRRTTLPPLPGPLPTQTLPPPPPLSPPPPPVAATTPVLVQNNALDDETFENVQEENPSTSSHVTWHDSASDEGVVFSSSDASLSQNSWVEEDEEEEEEIIDDDHQYYEPNLDWINDIARPRSYWEDQRQSRYQEVFESSANIEIRQLIERGSVSSVLASDFRDRMDQLMMSCVHRHVHGVEIDDDDEDEEDQCMTTFLSRQMQSLNEEEQQEGSKEEIGGGGDQQQVIDMVVEEREDIRERRQEEGEEEEVDDVAEQESSSSHQYHENSDYFEQTPLLQLPWSNYQDTEVISNDSDHVDDSTPLHNQQHESLTTQSYDHDSQKASLFKKSSSIEMELIYDLRLHMVQLYREMAELRKSINSCMDLQEKLQESIKDEALSTMSLPDSERRDVKESNKKAPGKGFCCICYEKKVDSLLYRCGHMCACFKCAHELQCGSGKCPICHAQILDVVRAYVDS